MVYLGWHAFYRCPFCNNKLVQNNPPSTHQSRIPTSLGKMEASVDVASPLLPSPYWRPHYTVGAPDQSSSHPRQALLVFVLYCGFFSMFSIRRPATIVHGILKPQLHKLCPPSPPPRRHPHPHYHPRQAPRGCHPPQSPSAPAPSPPSKHDDGALLSPTSRGPTR